MTNVSVMIISLNEGDALRSTVDSMSATLPPGSEIIVVDDGSTDGSTDFLRDQPSVTLLQPAERLGVAKARNFGAQHAHGKVLVFSDAHVTTPAGWCEPLVDLLAHPEVGAVAPAVSMMQPAGASGYGQKWSDASLAVEWLGRQSTASYPVPLLCGCFLAMRRDLFTEVGEFDPGMLLWGAEDAELSMRLWTLGYECWVVPRVEVQHAFRARFPYEVKWEPVLHNRLRLASLHFGPQRLARVLQRLKQYDEFARASARLLCGDLGSRQSVLRAKRRFDDDWFFGRFPTELQSELLEPGSATNGAKAARSALRPVTQPIPRESVSACLVSWKRPQNLPLIVRSLRSIECIDEILIWNNNPDVPLEISDSRTRVIPSDKNLSCYGRYLCAAQARNPVVYVQDDDALNGNIPGLYREFLDNPTKIAHALAPTHWNERHRYVYGDAQAALLGWGAFFHKDWLSVLQDLSAPTREDPLFQREADKFFTLLLERKHIALPGEITHLDGHSTSGIALWLDPRRQQITALAIREALRLLRTRKNPTLPVRWNVVIPCHNYGRFLGPALESVLSNDADYEINIVDDGSTDATPTVADSFLRRYPHIHYLRNEVKRGTGCSRNRGIAALDSEFVVLLDADDRIGPDYLFWAGRKLAAGVDVANPDAILFGARQERWNVPEATTLEMLLQRNSVHCASAFRRQLWSQTGGIDEQMPCWMDYEFWIRLAAAGARIQRLHGDHFFYRTHVGSLSESAGQIESELRTYLRQKHANLYARL